MEEAVDRDVRQDVADVLVRYATAIDQRDWALFRTCFTDDCEADYGAIGVWRSVDEITEWMAQVHDACGHTMHRISNVAVSPGAGDGVVARCYVDAAGAGARQRRGRPGGGLVRRRAHPHRRRLEDHPPPLHPGPPGAGTRSLTGTRQPTSTTTLMAPDERSAAARNASAASSRGNRWVMRASAISGRAARSTAACCMSRPPSWLQ